MSVQRCPKCNKILSPQESRCSNCGAKLDNNNIVQINDIYHSSNVTTLIFFALFFIWALLFGFVNWMVATAVTLILLVIVVYFKFFRK
ncbi:MAG: hypothetical protein IJG09_10065 [Methanobrevibacter sp.]|nr:hypothetical protein [Methanobrevibacter sp.]